MIWTGVLAVLAATAAPAGGTETPVCTGRVLRPVTDDMGRPWTAGRTLSLDIARVEGDARSFCAHGGACLPATAGGRPAVRLTNCRVGPALGGGDFRLVADASRMGAADAARWRRRQAAEARLSALGFSNAASAKLADAFVDRPASQDGELTAQALSGSGRALATLRSRWP